MKHRIIKSPEILIIGKKAVMSFETINEDTSRLARKFMPRLNEVNYKMDDYRLSLQNYDNFDYKKILPTATFEKWVGVEVSNFNNVPEGMETLTIKAGNYLVIDFIGSMQEFIKKWHYIHSQWLQVSGFKLDNRPHFEKLNPRFSPMNTVNEEEIWVPVI